MKECLITIIVPIYNAEKYLSKCLNSIINQTYKNLEIILVNDGSTDNSGNICQKYSEKDKRIKIIQKNNEGVSKARNDAIEIAKGKYIVFADSDDFLELTMVEKMEKSAEDNDSDIVICEYNNFIENENRFEHITLKDYKDKLFKDLISDEETLYGGFPWNKMIKRECISKNYRTDIHYYENLIFFLDNSNNFNKYSVVHEKLYNYCINDKSAVHNKEYSIKKLSTVVALDYVINLVDDQYKDFYKSLYIARTNENLFFIKLKKINNEEIIKYKKKAKEYYKDIKNSKDISLKTKMKMFIIVRMGFIYNIYKSIKVKREG